MRRVTFALAVLGVVVAGGTALASAPAPSSAPAPAPSSAPSSAPAFAGLAVVALGGATDAAWPLARSLYAEPSLRASGVDEAHARVLCGVAAASTDPAELRDLADTVAAIRGDDAPSRALLESIAHRLAARALVVVRVDAGQPAARLFLEDTGAFDAAAYAPDGPTAGPTGTAASAPSWSGAIRSLQRAFGPTVAATGTSMGPVGGGTPAPALATSETSHKPSAAPSRPFYESLWFWGAIGAAALAGGATYFATRDSSPSTIHLEVQVPR